MTKKQINCYFATTYNNGVPLRADDLRDIENKFISHFKDGLTIYPLRGIWFNRVGARFDDPIMLVQVVAEEGPDLLARISDIAALVLERFGQEVVFMTLGDVDVLSFCNGQDNQSGNKGGVQNGRLSKKLPEALTPREHQVLAFVTAGYTNRELAQSLWIAEATVERHLHNLFRKLAVSNRTQAAIFALSNGIVQSKDAGIPSRLKN